MSRIRTSEETLYETTEETSDIGSKGPTQGEGGSGGGENRWNGDVAALLAFAKESAQVRGYRLDADFEATFREALAHRDTSRDHEQTLDVAKANVDRIVNTSIELADALPGSVLTGDHLVAALVTLSSIWPFS